MRKSGAKNRFIAIRFVGGNQTPTPSKEWSSRDGLGTFIELELADGSKIYREHRLDDGFKAQNSATMVIGIGPREIVQRVTVRWLSGKTQSTSEVPSGTLLTIHEDRSTSPNGEAFVRIPYAQQGSELAGILLASPGMIPRQSTFSSSDASANNCMPRQMPRTGCVSCRMTSTS